MSLPGSIIKKILDALISGFPTEEKLKQILYLDLNITSATYPDGEDYENRVVKLLEKLDAQGRIIELVEGEHPNLARRPKKGKIIRELSSRIMVGLYECCP